MRLLVVLVLVFVGAGVDRGFEAENDGWTGGVDVDGESEMVGTDDDDEAG